MTISRQFQQLPLFMTGDELAGLHSGDYNKPFGEVTTRDFHIAHGVLGAKDVGNYRGSLDHGSYIRSMRKSIEANEGISEPVHVWHPDQGPDTLVDGHHRSKVAHATGRLVPVIHHEGSMDDVHQSIFLKGLDL